MPCIGSNVRSSSVLGTAAFLPNGQIRRLPFDIKEQRRGIPGPLAYFHNDDFRMRTYKPKSLRKLPSASLRSASNRESFLDSTSSVPGPGLYDVAVGYNATTVMRSTNFSSSNDLQRPPIADNEVPGPGSYYKDSLVFDKRNSNSKQPNKSKLLISKNCINHGSNILETEALVSNSILEFIGVSDFRKEPHTFGPGAGLRFKNTYFGRLDLIKEIPGPGAYTPNLYCREKNSCSSCFRSRSPKIHSPLKHPSLRPPGPLYYDPKRTNDVKSTFNFNRDNSWV